MPRRTLIRADSLTDRPSPACSESPRTGSRVRFGYRCPICTATASLSPPTASRP